MKLKSIPIFYKKIKTAEQFNGVLSVNHNPVKLLGIGRLGFNPKFKTTQEIFESATKNAKSLLVPQNLSLKLKGVGNQKMALITEKGSRFYAPKATFADTEIGGDRIYLKTVEGIFTTKNNAKGKIGKVEGYSRANDNAQPKIGEVRGSLLAYDNAKPQIGEVKGSLLAHDNAKPQIGKVGVDSMAYDNAKPEIHVVGGDSHALDNAQPKIGEVKGNSKAFNYSQPQIGKLGGDSIVYNNAQPQIGKSKIAQFFSLFKKV